MQRWQYVSLRTDGSSGTYFYNGSQKIRMCSEDENEIISALNRLGNDGWELVSTTLDTPSVVHQNQIRTFLLKRLIQE